MSLMHRPSLSPLWAATRQDRRPILVIGGGQARSALLSEIAMACRESWCEDELYSGIDAVLSDPRGWSAVIVLAESLEDSRGAQRVCELLSVCDPVPLVAVVSADAPFRAVASDGPAAPLWLSPPVEMAACGAANRVGPPPAAGLRDWAEAV